MNVLFYPLALLYGAAVSARNRLYDTGLLKSRRFGVPVVSVGNIAVGGTGKTPHIEYLIGLLSRDFRVAVLSRGYKRRSKGFRYVEAGDASIWTGDEPLQIKRKHPDVTVAVDADRVGGIERLLRDFPALDLILLDDAFQHRRVAPSANVVLIEYGRPFWKDFLLPAGRLRDCRSSLRRADFVLITKCPENISSDERDVFVEKLRKYGKPVFFSSFEYGRECRGGRAESVPSDSSELLALSGIANPVPFFGEIEKRYPAAKIERLIFPDHHDFSEKDVARIIKKARQRTVITTEKDYVRLIPFIEKGNNDLAKYLFYLPVKVKFIDEGENFDSAIRKHAGHGTNQVLR